MLCLIYVLYIFKAQFWYMNSWVSSKVEFRFHIYFRLKFSKNDRMLMMSLEGAPYSNLVASIFWHNVTYGLHVLFLILHTTFEVSITSFLYWRLSVCCRNVILWNMTSSIELISLVLEYVEMIRVWLLSRDRMNIPFLGVVCAIHIVHKEWWKLKCNILKHVGCIGWEKLYWSIGSTWCDLMLRIFWWIFWLFCFCLFYCLLFYVVLKLNIGLMFCWGWCLNFVWFDLCAILHVVLW